MSNPENKQHASAAGVYGDKAKETAGTQRELEGQLLLKYARKMQDLQSKWDKIEHKDLDEVLTFNRKLWTLFYDAALEEKEGDVKRPKDLRNNIIALSEYIFNRTIKILANPEKEKLNILIEINKEVAAGLMAKPEGEQAQEPQEKEGETSSSEEQGVQTNISA